MADEGKVHLRSPEELSPEEREELERALDSGITELPQNQPKGFLGQKAPDMRKPEDFSPDMNAGLLQENDPGVMGLVIVLAFLLFFPVGYVLLWRDKHLNRRTKWIASVVVAVIVGAIALRIALG